MRNRTRPTTKEEVLFIAQNWDKYTRSQLVEKLNEKFTDVTRTLNGLYGIVSEMKEHGIKLSEKPRESGYQVKIARNNPYELAKAELENKVSIGEKVTKFYGKIL